MLVVPKPEIDAKWRSMSMQIVIVKSPKLFSGILRKLFGIKKESYID